MYNFERTCDMVNAYVKEHGRKTEMGRGEFIEWVHEKYENISVEKNNLYPTDISFNLYNNGQKISRVLIFASCMYLKTTNSDL